MISWPRDFRPGINKDVQTEINRQSQDRYDIYLGVLGSIFGTPTQRAGSGTEEEFEIALTKYLKDTTSIRVLFYFKRLGVDPFTIDLEQLNKVKNFRDKLSKKGIIYKDFKDTSNFVDLVKNDLLNLITDEWSDNKWNKIELPSLNESIEFQEDKIEEKLKQEEHLIIENDEIGYIDLIEDFYTYTNSFVTRLEEMTNYTSQIGDQLQNDTKKILELTEKIKSKKNIGGSREAQSYLAEAKKVINDAANDIDSYTEKVAPYVSIFKNELGFMLNKFFEYCNFSDSQLQNIDQKKKDVGAFKGFLITMEAAIEGITQFQVALKNLPNTTSKLIKSRKRAALILGEFIAEIKIAVDQGKEIITKLEND